MVAVILRPAQDEVMSKKNPWTKLKSAIKYENPWIKVREDNVLKPNGEPGIYGVVEFKNTAMGIVALNDREEVVLVGQYRYPLNEYSWEIPEGGCPEGEKPLQAAKRELLEETGLKARSWKKLFEMSLSNSSTNERAVVFLATGLSQHAAQPEDTEVLKKKTVNLKNAVDMVLSGEITDAISVAALLYAGRKL
jgi:8-oxo-dGTP pyrophosphatase MutT (NUDIX family)